MAAPAIVERLDVVKETGARLDSRALRVPCTRSFFRLLKKLSLGALSQQLPLRLIEHTMAYSRSRAGKAWLAYWLPRSE